VHGGDELQVGQESSVSREVIEAHSVRDKVQVIVSCYMCEPGVQPLQPWIDCAVLDACHILRSRHHPAAGMHTGTRHLPGPRCAQC
jgi:hypothetical protein